MAHIGPVHGVRGSPPLAAHQPPGVVAVAAAAAITRPRLSTPLCARRRLSLFRDIRFPTSPHSVRGATERKHLDILEYEHCVNIRSILPSSLLALSLYLPRFLLLVSRVSFLMRVLRAGQRYDRWNHSHSSVVPRLPVVMADYGPRAENETFLLFS